ncbi:MAG TPA: hypothetical protein VEV17_19020 [Bryobacteraceae bacterium]|nr:hypothetical protein [Bryobacteraceae bacterium]
MRHWKGIALLLSITLNVAMLAGYVYGMARPKPVESSLRAVAPALRDPNLTPAQIQSIKRIQATRNAWLRDFSDRYRDEMLGILNLLEARDPDWNEINHREANLVAMRREYQDVQVRGWSDIHRVLTPEQGKEYIQALRRIVGSLDFGHAAGPGR